jgi:hypothetical protein
VQENQGQYATALRSYLQALAIYQRLGEHGASEDGTLNNIKRVRANFARR